MEMSELEKLKKKKKDSGKKIDEDVATMAIDETVFLAVKDVESACSGSSVFDVDYKIPILPKNYSLSLEIVSGENTGKTYSVIKKRITVGRGDGDFNFDDIQASRKHASIELLPNGHVSLSDLASTNGTLLNGKDVTSKLIKDGDVITIGKTEMKVNITVEGSESLV